MAGPHARTPKTGHVPEATQSSPAPRLNIVGVVALRPLLASQWRDLERVPSQERPLIRLRLDPAGVPLKLQNWKRKLESVFWKLLGSAVAWLTTPQTTVLLLLLLLL
jgi:hypothetical protein